MMNSRVKQIALGRADFSDRPVIIADIIICGKLSVFICGVGVNEFLALVNAVNRTRKGSVALHRSCFRIGFRHGYIEFFKNVRKAAACNLFPFNRGGLAFGNDIADRRIHFLNHIRGIAADKDILKFCNAVFISHGILVNGQAAKGSAVKVEFHSLHKIVLRVFDNLQRATLQGVVEVYSSGLSADKGHGLALLRLIAVNGLFRDGIGGRE